MSDATETQGTIVQIGNTDSPPVFIDIAEIKEFDGPNGSASVIDVSHLRPPRREKRMGLPDEGQLTINANYVGGDVGQAALRAARADRGVRPFKLLLTSGEILSLDGFVLNFNISGGVDAVVALSITIEITGEVTSSLDA